jgi:hypothetical protein
MVSPEGQSLMSGSDQPALLGEQSSHDTPPEEAGAAVQAPDAADPGTFRSWLFGFVQRTFLLLGIYVLSFGPMYWHWYGGRFAGGSQIVAAFYEPIVVIATFVPWFGEWMDWYVGLWIA